MDPIELLARDDKWQLGAGESAVFAPAFPMWLDAPGFWDEATVFHYPLAPVFTVACLGDDGREVALRARGRRWTPAELTVEFELSNGMAASEVRTVQPDGVFASEWRFRAPAPSHLHVVAWTAYPAEHVDLASTAWRGELAFVRTLRDESGAALDVEVEVA